MARRRSPPVRHYHGRWQTLPEARLSAQADSEDQRENGDPIRLVRQPVDCLEIGPGPAGWVARDAAVGTELQCKEIQRDQGHDEQND